jgi:hypothetical protein
VTNGIPLTVVTLNYAQTLKAESLSTLAGIIGRTSDVPKFKSRAASQRALIAANLWDEEGGIYTNLRWNGSFYRRISPTSFYSMMSGAPTDTQAAAMVENWLLSPDHFCVAKDGDFKGNKDTCYWGLPSIQASDSAYPALGYWRGYVWGPMAQLTYWSLQEYDHVPVVRSGRKALCKQMTALMRSQWNIHRHICENYNPHKNADTSHGDCSGTKFYHCTVLGFHHAFCCVRVRAIGLQLLYGARVETRIFTRRCAALPQ